MRKISCIYAFFRRRVHSRFTGLLIMRHAWPRHGKMLSYHLNKIRIDCRTIFEKQGRLVKHTDPVSHANYFRRKNM